MTDRQLFSSHIEYIYYCLNPNKPYISSYIFNKTFINITDQFFISLTS